MNTVTPFATIAALLTVISAAPAQTVSVHPDGEGAGGRGAAYDPREEPAPEEGFSFGAGTQDFVVLASSCRRWTATPIWIHGNFRFFGNDIAVPSSSDCPVSLPNGARITGMQCTVEDST